MDHQLLATSFLHYLNSLTPNQTIGDWRFVGLTNEAFGTPGGPWIGAQGYEFNHVDGKFHFIIRSIPNIKNTSYWAIESVTLRRQLYNIHLSKNNTTSRSNGQTTILESYVMGSAKGKFKKAEVRKAFEKLGVTSKIISVISDENPNWAQTTQDLLQWSISREQVKLKLNSDREYLDDEPEEVSEIIPNMKTDNPLNLILYGPPGTGKTYNSIAKALEILGDKDLGDRTAVKQRFDERVKEGRIVFTTFHQSMTYEDFIEGIKPVELPVGITYRTEPGLFKKICAQAAASGAYGANFDEAYQSLMKEIQESTGKKLVLETLYQAREFSIYENSKGNLKFHANTEKAYEAVVRKDYLQHYLQTGECLDWPSYIKAIGQYLRTRHGYKDGKIGKPNDYVLIIDEINRGNISQIFGELITLIEPDKRQGKDEALTATLPYSKEPFGVPPNLYIIGTMNTADRSVEALDTALRRRFSFEAIPPKPDLLTPNRMIWNLLLAYEAYDWDEELYAAHEEEVLRFLGAEEKVKSLMQKYWDAYDSDDSKTKKQFDPDLFSGITLESLLKTINDRIEKLLDADHQIGHSYFLKVGTLEYLQQVFYRNVIPLLQEYFFGDYGKIGLVLGKGFVRKKAWNNGDGGSFADFDGYEAEGNFDEREVFEIVDYTQPAGQEYKLIIEKRSYDMNFEKAIRLLLKLPLV